MWSTSAGAEVDCETFGDTGFLGGMVSSLLHVLIDCDTSEFSFGCRRRRQAERSQEINIEDNPDI